MSLFSWHGEYGHKTDVHVDVKPNHKEANVVLCGGDFLDAFSQKIHAYFEWLKTEQLANKSVRDARKKEIDEEREREMSERTKEREAMKAELKALADTYERPASFWRPEVTAEEAMAQARDVMSRRKPGLLFDIDHGILSTMSFYDEFRASFPRGPEEIREFTEAKRYMDTAEQFPSVTFDVPVRVISTVRSWTPPEKDEEK